MQQMPWSTRQIKQCEKEIGQAMLSDEHTLVSYGQDFGKIAQSNPAVVCIPESIETIKSLFAYANQNKLSVTIRGKGLSQGGQSLSVAGGLILHVEKLDKVLAEDSDSIWVEANTTWAKLLETTLKNSQAPYVLPYNCNLSIGGVLSAAGIGASSFKNGPISAHVKALEVILANGEVQVIDAQHELFQACLSGQGRFALISKACIKLRPCLNRIRTFFLVYSDRGSWLNDLSEMKNKADYIEAFCSPAMQGTKLIKGKRLPFARWLFSIQVSIEYENTPPQFSDIKAGLNPWQLIHQQDESIHSYLHRHDSRFEMMKLTGQWDLFHPWYECFMSKKLLAQHMDELLAELPLHYASLIQVVPLANLRQTGFFMLPDENEVYELMILNPGVNPAFISNCLDVIYSLDSCFLKQGGKRYLSGYLGSDLKQAYWHTHFGLLYEKWLALKKIYDPQEVFCSWLLSNSLLL